MLMVCYNEGIASGDVRGSDGKCFNYAGFVVK